MKRPAQHKVLDQIRAALTAAWSKALHLSPRLAQITTVRPSWSTVSLVLAWGSWLVLSERQAGRKELGAYVITDGVIALGCHWCWEPLKRCQDWFGSRQAQSLAHVCSHLELTRQMHVPPPLQPPGEAISHADMVIMSFEPIECQMRVNAAVNWPLGNPRLARIVRPHHTPLYYCYAY